MYNIWWGVYAIYSVYLACKTLDIAYFGIFGAAIYYMCDQKAGISPLFVFKHYGVVLVESLSVVGFLLGVKVISPADT